MSLPVIEEQLEFGTGTDESAFLLEARSVSKRYHLWESPRARFDYGLWSQVPSWAPKALQRLAQERKAKLGRDFYALREVSLRLCRGESIAILGRNGSGKSTLLQVICGILQPSGGVIVRRCRRIAALLELGSGFNPEFTGRENVYLNGAVLGLEKGEIDARFGQILEFAEISQFIDQPVKTYSSGMMVRLAFAMQVQLDPELLIVDEALAVGDIFFQQKCFAYMHQLKERGCSFLIVSHDASAIQQICDRGIVLVEGRKHYEGNSRDAIREYHLTVAGRRKMISISQEPESVKRNAVKTSDFEEPERWFHSTEAESDTAALAKLTRWSCTDALGKIVDHFFPGERIRLFVEFECRVSANEASVGFAIRDKSGQIIHGKHQYQMGLRTKICQDPPFFLLCEFSLTCHLAPGQYTFEFGLIDIVTGATQSFDTIAAGVPNEYFEILSHRLPVGRFAVIPERIDPIQRTGHFGMVDVSAETTFEVTRV
jgi:lipopolysaccharide transport system ATP-binding protein